MTILTSLILVAAIIGVATAIAYNVQKGTKTLEEMRSNYYDNEAAQESEALIEEVLEKPVIGKAPKKEKVTELVESMKKVTAAHDTLIEEINRVALNTTTVTIEAVVEAPKKKKGHRYNRKPKAPTT